MVVLLFIYFYNPFNHRAKIKTVQQGDLNLYLLLPCKWPVRCSLRDNAGCDKEEDWRQLVNDISHQSRWRWSSLCLRSPAGEGAHMADWWLMPFPPRWKRAGWSQMAGDTAWVIKTTQAERLIFSWWWLCYVLCLNQGREHAHEPNTTNSSLVTVTL